jgi:hypothetical protein
MQINPDKVILKRVLATDPTVRLILSLLLIVTVTLVLLFKSNFDSAVIIKLILAVIFYALVLKILSLSDFYLIEFDKQSIKLKKTPKSDWQEFKQSDIVDISSYMTARGGYEIKIYTKGKKKIKIGTIASTRYGVFIRFDIEAGPSSFMEDFNVRPIIFQQVLINTLIEFGYKATP